ncbi:MAG: SDR family oxidoreductase [Gammaproteobacteria bacterium]|nr:SDR family oxidoreductase [Gammaproteobacteria bacterium]
MSIKQRNSDVTAQQGAVYPSLQGRSVFITGGGSGIGGCLTEAFARQRSRVAFVDIAAAPSQALADKIEKAGLPRPWYSDTDVTDIPALQAAIRDAATALGDFHVLINNVANDDRHSFMDVTPDYYDARIAVNQRPAFFAIQAVVPGMKKLGGGSIVNFGSNSYGSKARNLPVYTTAKSSVIGLTRGLAAELGEHRIRVNVITPGWIMTQRQIDKWLTDEGELNIQRNQVLPDKVYPEDVVPLALFLASDDARACSAQEYIVDAGWL